MSKEQSSSSTPTVTPTPYTWAPHGRLNGNSVFSLKKFACRSILGRPKLLVYSVVSRSFYFPAAQHGGRSYTSRSFAFLLATETVRMIETSGDIEAICFPRYPPESSVNNIKLLPNPPDGNYGIFAAPPNSLGNVFGGSHATEASSLTHPEKALSFIAKTWQGVAGEIERARNALVTTEKDVEQGGACSAFALLSVTVRKPLTPSKLAALGYSFMPFLLFIFALMSALCTWAVLPFFAAAVQLSLTLLNERLFKRLIREPRPALSLVKSPGMPSSHCLVSYAFLIWFLLEAAVSSSPLPSRVFLACLSVGVFGPMPWARYYLDDHSEMQCFVGCLGGALWGVFVFVLRHIAFPAAALI